MAFGNARCSNSSCSRSPSTSVVFMSNSNVYARGPSTQINILHCSYFSFLCLSLDTQLRTGTHFFSELVHYDFQSALLNRFYSPDAESCRIEVCRQLVCFSFSSQGFHFLRPALHLLKVHYLANITYWSSDVLIYRFLKVHPGFCNFFCT